MDKQKKFCADMMRAGYAVERYRGRYFYDGWAVRCAKHELQRVIRETDIPLQWDSMGMGLIVYPYA